MSESFQFADVLGEFIGRSGFTSGQLSKHSSIPKPTIVNWLEGRVKKPRGVEDLLLLSIALHLSEEETSRLLTSAGHPSVENLRITAVTANNDDLLHLLNQIQSTPIQQTHAPFQAFADNATFVGRKNEIETIKKLILSDRTPKFISIQGMGGVGKTALALHIAHHLKEHFPDGVLWARVSQSDAQSILFAFAMAYGVDVSHLSDIHIRSQTVRDLLANKKVLIIFDDVEASAQITPLLPPALKGTVIWTTRRRDLSILRKAVQIQLKPFDENGEEAIALFNHVLGEEKVEEERPYFKQISQLLGQLPLALDIAASRLAFEPGWTAEEFLATLEHEISMIDELKFEENDIRLSFITSFERLDVKSKHLFKHLVIFGQNDFSVSACSEIFEVPLIQIKKLMRQLYGLSLISISVNQSNTETRYQLHAIIFDYLRTLINENPYEHNLVQFLIQQLQKNRNDYLFINREYPHYLASLSISKDKKSFDLLSSLVNSLYSYWEAIGDFHTAQFWLGQCSDLSDEKTKTSLNKIELIFNTGRLQERLGNYIEAESYYGDALILAREIDATFQLSHILRRLGVLASRRSDYVLAEAYYKEGIQLARRMHGGNAVSDFLRGLGVQAYMLGQLAKAESFYEEGLSLMHLNNEQVRQPRGQIGRIWGLGHVALEQGDFHVAEAQFEQALELAQQIGLRDREIQLLRSQADLHHKQNRSAKSKVALEQAFELAQQMGIKWQEARIAGEIGEVELINDDHELAEPLFRRQFELARILNSPEMVGISMFGLARVAKCNENQEMASHYANQSLESFVAIGHENVQSVTDWIQKNLYIT